MASIARDDPSTLPSDDPFPHARTPRPQCAVNWDRNLKPKLAIMCQCTSVTDGQTLTSWHKREMYILHLALKNKHIFLWDHVSLTATTSIYWSFSWTTWVSWPKVDGRNALKAPNCHAVDELL